MLGECIQNIDNDLEPENECEYTPEEVVAKLLGLAYISECEENVFQIMQKVSSIFRAHKQGYFNQMRRFHKGSNHIVATGASRLEYRRGSKEKVSRLILEFMTFVGTSEPY